MNGRELEVCQEDCTQLFLVNSFVPEKDKTQASELLCRGVYYNSATKQCTLIDPKDSYFEDTFKCAVDGIEIKPNGKCPAGKTCFYPRQAEQQPSLIQRILLLIGFIAIFLIIFGIYRFLLNEEECENHEDHTRQSVGNKLFGSMKQISSSSLPQIQNDYDTPTSKRLQMD